MQQRRQTETETDDYAYEAFGAVAASSGTTETPYQWIGQKVYYHDSDSSLYSLRRREYPANEGRFLSPEIGATHLLFDIAIAVP